MLDFGPYSSFKAAHVMHKQRLEDLAMGKLPSPAQIQVVITNRCNHRCSFCAYRSERSDSSQTFDHREQIPTERCLRLMGEFRDIGAQSIQFTGGGEPTVHADFPTIITKAQSLGLKTALVTNGELVNTLSAETLLNLSWIRFSIDAGTPNTYTKIRRISEESLKRVVDNIENVVKLKKKHSHGPLIGIGFVVNPENYQETFVAIANAVGLGVDNIRISAAFFKDSVKEHEVYLRSVHAQITRGKEEFGKEIKIFDLFGDRVEDLVQKGPKYKTCYYSRLVPYIGGDQNVYTCCCLAYNQNGLIGSIRDISFVDFWKQIATKYYASHTTKNCNICMYNGKNEFIKYMIDPEAEHVECI